MKSLFSVVSNVLLWIRHRIIVSGGNSEFNDRVMEKKGCKRGWDTDSFVRSRFHFVTMV